MLKRILIDIRDFTYHYAKRQSGLEVVETEYLFKMMGALFLYYFSIIISITIFIRKAFLLQQNPTLTLLIRLMIGLISLVPALFLVKGLLRLVKSTPIPNELSEEAYRKKRNVTIAVFFIGAILFFLSFLVPTYLIGGKIHIGDYILQQK